MEKIKCYCGHTDYCDCGEIEPQIKTSNMKLYTEEQVRKIYCIAYLGGHSKYIMDFEEDVKLISPIELPSDEEIKDKSFNKFAQSNARICFEEGAKWMKEQILNQNK